MDRTTRHLQQRCNASRSAGNEEAPGRVFPRGSLQDAVNRICTAISLLEGKRNANEFR
jgi:hypothetical protein